MSYERIQVNSFKNRILFVFIKITQMIIFFNFLTYLIFEHWFKLTVLV